MTFWLLMLLMVAMTPGSSPPTRTPTFKEITGEVRDIRDPAVPNATVKKYLDALTFPPQGKGTLGDIDTCHGCSTTVRLEIVAEMGTVELKEADLAAEGRIVARIRRDDWKFWRRQEDTDLRWPGDEAYLWVAGRQIDTGRYEAAVVRIHPSGKRTSAARGTISFCSHEGTSPAGVAHWKPPHECVEQRGRLKPTDFHLTQWVPCTQGCCVFIDQ